MKKILPELLERGIYHEHFTIKLDPKDSVIRIHLSGNDSPIASLKELGFKFHGPSIKRFVEMLHEATPGKMLELRPNLFAAVEKSGIGFNTVLYWKQRRSHLPLKFRNLMAELEQRKFALFLSSYPPYVREETHDIIRAEHLL
jgi:hypothetical protein